MSNNPFKRGDFLEDVTAHDCWHVLDVHGNQVFVGDVGYEVSNVIKEWRPHTDFILWEDDEDEWDDEESES